MGNVTALRPHEVVRLDMEVIAVIYRNLGPATAELMVARALGELALAMAGIAAQVKTHQLSTMARQLTKLQRMAENVGLDSLGKVAEDARVCLERADSTAFSAVWARLIRVAEKSLAREPGAVDLSV